MRVSLRRYLLSELLLILCLLVLFECTGCVKPNAEPVERAVNMIVTNVVTPAIEKIVEETSTTSAQLQGGAEVIDPGYEGEFEGFWVTGLKGKISVRAKGLAGRISGSTQSTGPKSQAPQPADKKDADTALEPTSSNVNP